MKRLRWQTIQKLRELAEETSPPPEQMALRLRMMERNVILPVKAVFVLILIYNLYFSSWFEDMPCRRPSPSRPSSASF